MERSQFGKELKVGYATHEGMVGKENEDFFGVFAYKVDNNHRLYIGVVADGVGGQTAGEVASHLAVAAVQTYFDRLQRVDNISLHLEQAVLAANESIYRSSQENPEYMGMAATMVIVGVIDNRLYQATVGDSRIYIMRDGRLMQTSVDHTWAQEAIEAGLLSPEQAKSHPNRNVIRRHLGGSLQVEVDHRFVLKPGESTQQALANQGAQLRAGDTLLLCSDGLTDMITDVSVQESMHKHFFDLPAAAQELVDKANRAGGKDNITLILIQVPTNKAPVLPIAAPVVASATATGAVKVAAAAPKTPAPAPAPVAAPSKKSKMPLLLIGVAALFLLIILGAGAAFVLSSSLASDSTPTATNIPGGIIDPERTLPPGAPATAAILATLGTKNAFDNISPENTPELIPTLRATLTPTRKVLPTRTSLPASPTSTATARQSGGGPQPTSTRGPANTAVPTNPPAPTSPPPTTSPPSPTTPPEPTQPPPPTAPPPPTTPPEPTSGTGPGCQNPPCN